MVLRLSGAMALALATTFTANVGAVDGVTLLDQNVAQNGLIPLGDAPGFPITLNFAGSYRLSGNLVLTSANTTAIVINTDNVTIDLNGFGILGPVTCNGLACTDAGVGNGIEFLPLVAGENITVRNGRIDGVGNDGIRMKAETAIVENMQISDTGRNGIRLEAGNTRRGGVVVRDNSLANHGANGIMVLAGGLITGNAVDQARGHGIRMDGSGAVDRNVVTNSLQNGLLLNANSHYSGNVLRGNATSVSGGLNQGQNACNGATCPGAQF